VGPHYRVTRLLGRGGMGVVAEATHEQHGSKVALKVLHTRHLQNEEAVTRFFQEGRAAARVRGEHSVRLFDMGTTADGRPYLVMELLVGCDLAARLEEGALSIEDAASYILQACEGMAEVHAHGMVHRDLKPSNLFLARTPDDRPVVKVLDFGIAKGVAEAGSGAPALTQDLVGMGTPLYMSPEQIRSSREVDARADVWSLGAIFYELVAGKPAFGGTTVTQITAQVLESEPTPLTKLIAGAPPELDAIVRGALDKSPDSRFCDVAVLAAALEPLAGPRGAGAAARCARILAGALRADVTTSPPVARDDSLGGTRRFDRGRRKRWLGVLAAALGVLACGLMWAAVGAYRGAAEKPMLARRGIQIAAVRIAARATTHGTTAEPPALLLGSMTDPPAAVSSPASRPRPAGAAGVPSATAPAGAVPAPAKQFDPFDDRN